MGVQREALNGTGERLIMKAMMFIIQVAQCGPYKKKGLTNASAPEVLQVCVCVKGDVGHSSVTASLIHTLNSAVRVSGPC